MALTDDEARHFADNLIADYLAGVEPDPVSVYGLLTEDDQIPIGSHLLPRLVTALERFSGGDRGATTIKLVQLSLAMERHRETVEASRLEERLGQLRTKALAFGGNSKLAEEMTQNSGIYGIPLPASASRMPHDTWATDGYTPDQLVSFYLRFMAAAGWVLDLRASTPGPETILGGKYTVLVFGLPAPSRWVTIRIWDDPTVARGRPAIQLQIVDDDDPPVFDPLGMATPS